MTLEEIVRYFEKSGVVKFVFEGNADVNLNYDGCRMDSVYSRLNLNRDIRVPYSTEFFLARTVRSSGIFS